MSEPGSLGQRAARGAAVTLVGQLTRIAVQVGSIVVLSRLLTPDDYGLLAIVLVVVGIGEIFRDFGLTTAAVQAKELPTAQRDVLWWLNTAIGLTLCVVVVAGAPLLGAAFGRPELVALARVVALTFVVNGVATQYRAGLTRSLRFGRLVGADLVGQALGVTAAIVAAVAGAGYWALAVQQLVQVTTVLVLLVVAGRWRPGRPRRGSGVRPLLRLGGRLAGTQVLYYLMNNLDTLTVAVRFPSPELGLYNRGWQLVMNPTAQLRSPATTVALPVLSRLQDDHERAGRYLVAGQLAFGYSLVAGLALVVGVADPAAAVLLGPQWDGIVPVLRFLAAAAALSTLSFVGFWVYLSRGMGRDLLRYTLVSFAIQLVCIGVGSLWGVDGVAGGYAVAAAVEWPLSLAWLSRRTGIPVRALLGGAGRILAVGVLAGTAAFVVSEQTGGPAALRLLAGVGAGLAVYAVAVAAVPAVRRDLLAVIDIGRRVLDRRSPRTPAPPATPTAPSSTG